jgi:hypothetical protein
MAFEVAEKRLGLAGLTPYDLFIPEVEDFVARKGRRNDPSSRPPATALPLLAADPVSPIPPLIPT